MPRFPNLRRLFASAPAATPTRAVGPGEALIDSLLVGFDLDSPIPGETYDRNELIQSLLEYVIEAVPVMQRHASRKPITQQVIVAEEGRKILDEYQADLAVAFTRCFPYMTNPNELLEEESPTIAMATAKEFETALLNHMIGDEKEVPPLSVLKAEVARFVNPEREAAVEPEAPAAQTFQLREVARRAPETAAARTRSDGPIAGLPGQAINAPARPRFVVPVTPTPSNRDNIDFDVSMVEGFKQDFELCVPNLKQLVDQQPGITINPHAFNAVVISINHVLVNGATTKEYGDMLSLIASSCKHFGGKLYEASDHLKEPHKGQAIAMASLLIGSRDMPGHHIIGGEPSTLRRVNQLVERHESRQLIKKVLGDVHQGKKINTVVLCEALDAIASELQSHSVALKRIGNASNFDMYDSYKALRGHADAFEKIVQGIKKVTIESGDGVYMTTRPLITSLSKEWSEICEALYKRCNSLESDGFRPDELQQIKAILHEINSTAGVPNHSPPENCLLGQFQALTHTRVAMETGYRRSNSR